MQLHLSIGREEFFFDAGEDTGRSVSEGDSAGSGGGEESYVRGLELDTAGGSKVNRLDISATTFSVPSHLYEVFVSWRSDVAWLYGVQVGDKKSATSVSVSDFYP